MIVAFSRGKRIMQLECLVGGKPPSTGRRDDDTEGGGSGGASKGGGKGQQGGGKGQGGKGGGYGGGQQQPSGGRGGWGDQNNGNQRSTDQPEPQDSDQSNLSDHVRPHGSVQQLLDQSYLSDYAMSRASKELNQPSIFSYPKAGIAFMLNTAVMGMIPPPIGHPAGLAPVETPHAPYLKAGIAFMLNTAVMGMIPSPDGHSAGPSPFETPHASQEEGSQDNHDRQSTTYPAQQPELPDDEQTRRRRLSAATGHPPIPFDPTRGPNWSWHKPGSSMGSGRK